MTKHLIPTSGTDWNAYFRQGPKYCPIHKSLVKLIPRASRTHSLCYLHHICYFCLCSWLKWLMALCNEAVPQTLCLVWMLEMMSCRNNGLFWLVHIVKLSNGWTTQVHVLLLRSTRLCESRLMSRTVRSVLLERISIPTLKTQREKVRQ